MYQLRQQETAERLERVFGIQAESDSGNTPLNSISIETENAEPLILGSDSNPQASLSVSADSSEIKDNTYFRPEEAPAWFDTFARLQEKTPKQLAEESMGEITYAQFMQQPDVYRHRVVTIKGTVVREETEHPIQNPLGIERYHRLWLAPHGGGQQPLVVYCRDLPTEFPRGDKLREAVTVTGEFFKNWSYRYEGGFGLAPVVLAHDISWQPPTPKTNTPEVALPVTTMIWAATGAGVLALIVVWIAVRNTARRPRTSRALPSTFLPPDAGGDG